MFSDINPFTQVGIRTFSVAIHQKKIQKRTILSENFFRKLNIVSTINQYRQKSVVIELINNSDHERYTRSSHEKSEMSTITVLIKTVLISMCV